MGTVGLGSCVRARLHTASAGAAELSLQIICTVLGQDIYTQRQRERQWERCCPRMAMQPIFGRCRLEVVAGFSCYFYVLYHFY